MIGSTRLLSLAVVPAILLTSVSTAAAASPLVPADESTITLDASVEHTVSPDSIFASLNCEVTEPASESVMRETLKQKMEAFRKATGKSVRRSGPMNVYPFYGDMPMGDGSMPAQPTKFSGNVAFTISNLTKSDVQKVEALLDQEKCSAVYDARIKNSPKYIRQYRQQLMADIDESRAVFEEILGQKLTKVMSMYFSTTLDYQGGYYGGPSSVYDPETGTVPVMTSLSITFDIGTGKTK